jgi:hypothetical protein
VVDIDFDFGMRPIVGGQLQLVLAQGYTDVRYNFG